MRKHISIDDNLIITRIKQKEILDHQFSHSMQTSYADILATTSLRPFFSNSPLLFGLDLDLLGNKIIKASVTKDFLKQGIENTISGLSPYESIVNIERINIAAPFSYQAALMIAFEQLTSNINFKYEKLIAIGLEVNRIHHHAQVIKDIFICLNKTFLTSEVNQIIKILSPLNNLYQRIYTEQKVPRTISSSQIKNSLESAKEIILKIKSFAHKSELRNRLVKKANISLSLASSLGLTGIYIRANGAQYTPKNFTNIYNTYPKQSYSEGGDLYARFLLRIEEIYNSINWLIEALFYRAPIDKLCPIVINHDYCNSPGKLPFTFAEVNSPKGDIKVSIFNSQKNSKNLIHLKTADYFIAQSIPFQLVDLYTHDLPLILYSLGISATEVDK